MASTKICLDTSVVFDFLTGEEATVQKIKLYSNEDLCITSLTLFELRSVVDKQETVSEFLNFLSNVLEFDGNAADVAARIIKDDLHHGASRNTKSTMNAAICMGHNVVLFTKERSEFEGIRGLKLV